MSEMNELMNLISIWIRNDEDSRNLIEKRLSELSNDKLSRAELSQIMVLAEKNSILKDFLILLEETSQKHTYDVETQKSIIQNVYYKTIQSIEHLLWGDI